MEEYIKDLMSVQNHPENAYVEIMTIAGMMDDEQKKAHIVRYADMAGMINISNKYK